MGARTVASIAASVTFGVAAVGYPIAAYFAFRHLSPRVASAVLLAVFVPAAVSRLSARTRAALAPLALLPVLTVVLLLASAALGSTGLALLVPGLINATLLLSFGATLVWGPPIIERFARLQVDDLTPAELRWCRGWTWGWSAFFLVNGGIALALARLPTMDAWTTYNGLVAYLLMGTMFGVEYSVRKYRFGRLGTHALDRLLRRTFEALGRSHR
ncbi:MAG: hypothetical protein KDK70_15630 [Myxococcales bacterium]|nr:hypothetical protein [Myxococcales bacterium]